MIPNPDVGFWNSDPKIHFWAILGPKIQSCLFCLKCGAPSISRMLIPNPDLKFLKFRAENRFLGKFSPKNSKMFVWSENWYIWYLKYADSYSNISFLNFKSEFPLWANLDQKSQSCTFYWELTRMVSWKCRFQIRTYIFEIPTPKFIFAQVWVEKVKVVCFSWKSARMASWWCWFLFQH